MAITSIMNNRFPVGNPANFRNLPKGKYDCVVYQGDNGDMQFMNSCTIAANAWLPTGSIAYVEDNMSPTSSRSVPNIPTCTAKSTMPPVV